MSLIDQLRARNEEYERKYVQEHIPFINYVISVEELVKWEKVLSEALLEEAAKGEDVFIIMIVDCDLLDEKHLAVPLLTWIEKSTESIQRAEKSRQATLMSIVDTKTLSLLAQMRDFWNSQHTEIPMELVIYDSSSSFVEMVRVSWEKCPKRIKLE